MKGGASQADPVDKHEVLRRVLSLPISSWRYAWDEEGVRHIGPMAQDFHESFGLGGDEGRIDLSDAQGVALAAIQALHDLVADQQRQLDELRKRISRLDGS